MIYKENDIAGMPPWVQEQIRTKMQGGGQPQKRGGEPRRMKPGGCGQKYHNTPTTRTTQEGNVIRFPSLHEAERYDQLMLLLAAGAIQDLKLQPQFTLQEAYTTPQGVRVPAIRYVADFSYSYISSGKLVVEDAKGGRATQTRVYQIKKKLMLERFGIEVVEV